MFDRTVVQPAVTGGAPVGPVPLEGGWIDEAWMTDAEAAMRASIDADCLAGLIARPGFRSLLRPWVEAWRVGEDDSAILASSLRDMGRFVMGVWALYLEATPGGLTRGRLSELLEESGIASAGRAGSVLLFLRFLGYIATAPDQQDRRITRYRATDRMRKAFGDRFRRDLQVLSPIDPVIAGIAPVLDDPAAFGAYMASMGDHLRLTMMRLQTGEDSLDVFSQRFGGMAVLAELMLSAPEEAEFPPTGPLKLTVADLARRCQISRAGVRAVLQVGETAGFLVREADGSCRLTPKLRQHLDLLMAGCIVICAWSARQAAEAMNQSQARTG